MGAFDEGIRDHCGVSAVYLFNPGSGHSSSELVYRMMLAQQNRGDLSCGMSTFSEDFQEGYFRTKKGVGRVIAAFGESTSEKNKETLEYLAGRCTLGHNRYATSGHKGRIMREEEILAFSQPYFTENHRKVEEFAFAFNGNIINTDDLESKIKGDGYNLKNLNDTKLIQIELAKMLREFESEPKKEDYLNLFSHLSDKLDGAYSLVFVDATGTFIAVRDKYGIRPLCYALDESGVYVASETIALEKIGKKNIKPLQNGEILIVKNNGASNPIRYTADNGKKVCIFEAVYFSDAASTLEGRYILMARRELGKALARQEQVLDNKTYYDYVCPVPKTSIAMVHGFIEGMYEHHGIVISQLDVLISAGEGRTFINVDKEGRPNLVKNKFHVPKDIVKGKSIVLVDDSLVRGTTMKSMVKIVKKIGGAKEVHVRIAAAPNKYPCFMGIDMPDLKELIAFEKSIEDIKRMIEADSLSYLTIPQMIDAVAENGVLGEDELCDACFSGNYPTPAGKKRFDDAIRAHKAAKREEE